MPDEPALEAARAIQIIPSDDKSKWFIVDTSTAEPEVNWPGDLISEHDAIWQAEAALPEAIVRAYLTAALPQAEIDRLREALRKIAAMTGEDVVEADALFDVATAALHPETPNGDRNG